MDQQQESSSSLSSSNTAGDDQIRQEKLQLVDTLKAPIIERGRSFGYEVVENYDLGAGPIHVTWIFKPGGSESLPDIRLGFICITEFSQSSLNEAIARAMLNLMDKLILVVPTETMTKTVSESIDLIPAGSKEEGGGGEGRSILQLRKYITVLTPSTLISKSDVEGPGERRSSQTSEAI
jgi:hypothetical protein